MTFRRHRFGRRTAIPFSPDAPRPAVAGIAARATPYVVPPTECFMSLRTGAVTCHNTESVGELESPMYGRGGGYGSGLGRGMPLDSPLNRILTREPVGPWTLVGYATTDDPAMAQSRDRTMGIYSQTVDTRRDRYNYRVGDSNNVPLDLGEKVTWVMDGAAVTVPGQSATYTAHLYQNFR